MKNLTISFLIIISNVSCESTTKKIEESNEVHHEQLHQKSDEIKEPFQPLLFEETYPFSAANRVEIISYPIRHIWDTTNIDGNTYLNEGVIEDGKIRIKKSKIIDKIKLSNEETHLLFEVLYNTECRETMEMACYDPRHAFLFFDKKNVVFAAIEICFDCLNSEFTDGVVPFYWCFEKEASVSDYLKSVGVTYFGGADEEEGY